MHQKDYTCNLPPILLENYNCLLDADRCKGTVSLNYSHLCHLTLKSTKKDWKMFLEFLCHSDKPPTVRVPSGLHTAVWTNVTSSTSQHPSITSLQWPQIKDKETSWKHQILNSSQSYLESFTAAIGGSKMTYRIQFLWKINIYIYHQIINLASMSL